MDVVRHGEESMEWTMEWTLEHHKAFVDIVVRLGGFIDVGTPRIVVAEMMNNVKGLSQRTLVRHMVWFQLLNKRTHRSLGPRTAPSPPPCSNSDPYQSLVRHFDALHVEPPRRLTSWTVEHHKRVVEAVTELGGLNKATPAAVLRLMDEERRLQGLTVRTVRYHLSGAKTSRPPSWTVEDCKEVVEAIIKLGGLGGGDATPAKVLELVDSRRVGLTEKILEQILSRLQNLQERTRRTWRDHGGPLLPRRQCTWVRPVVAHPYARAREEIIMGESSWGRAIRNNPARIRMYSISPLLERRAKRIEKPERMESLATKIDNINLGGGSSGST